MITGVGAAGVATTDMLLAAGRARPRRLRPPGRALPRPPGPRPLRRARSRRATNPRGLRGSRRRGARGRRRLHRPLRRRAPSPSTAIARDGRRRDRLRDGEPDARGRARGDRGRSPPSSRTGRSDYPNQINNVLAFPGIFRGALDVRARDDQRGDEARGRPRRSPPWSSRTSSSADYVDPERLRRASRPRSPRPSPPPPKSVALHAGATRPRRPAPRCPSA